MDFEAPPFLNSPIPRLASSDLRHLFAPVICVQFVLAGQFLDAGKMVAVHVDFNSRHNFASHDARVVNMPKSRAVLFRFVLKAIQMLKSIMRFHLWCEVGMPRSCRYSVLKPFSLPKIGSSISLFNSWCSELNFCRNMR